MRLLSTLFLLLALAATTNAQGISTGFRPPAVPLVTCDPYFSIWSATLGESKDDFKTLVSPVYDFVNQTPDRVPLTDWYDTRTAKQVAFQARSVVGGVFIKMLADERIWRKWSARPGLGGVIGTLRAE